jgi:uncharacterized alkaline shock family protein YloU
VLATRRAVDDIVRSAVLGSYGVAGLAAGPVERIRAFLDGRPAGIRTVIDDGAIRVDLRIRVAHGLPIAEVARQVDSAVRYAIRRSLGREVARLAIRVGGLATHAGSAPPAPREHHHEEPRSGSDAGTDAA